MVRATKTWVFNKKFGSLHDPDEACFFILGQETHGWVNQGEMCALTEKDNFAISGCRPDDAIWDIACRKTYESRSQYAVGLLAGQQPHNVPTAKLSQHAENKLGASIAPEPSQSIGTVQEDQGAVVAKGIREFTLEELASHNTPESCWISIDGHVYDLTNFAAMHPGGAELLIAYSGKAVSEEFWGLHHPDVLAKYHDEYKIGTIIGYVATQDRDQDRDDLASSSKATGAAEWPVEPNRPPLPKAKRVKLLGESAIAAEWPPKSDANIASPSADAVITPKPRKSRAMSAWAAEWPPEPDQVLEADPKAKKVKPMDESAIAAEWPSDVEMGMWPSRQRAGCGWGGSPECSLQQATVPTGSSWLKSLKGRIATPR